MNPTVNRARQHEVTSWGSGMRIGDVATATGLQTQAIRFHERTGLLPPPGRSPNGYRVYDAATITRLEFIRSGRGQG